MEIEPELDSLTQRVIGCAIEVHKNLGPGLLESAYGYGMCHELTACGLNFVREQLLPVTYKGTLLECDYRLDIVVEGRLILELKAVAEILPIHRAQLLTYLKLSGIKLGLLLNFNVSLMKNGIVRIIH